MADITRKKNINPQRRDRTYPRVAQRARHNSYRVKNLATTASGTTAATDTHGQEDPGPVTPGPGRRSIRAG
jgi:hypothetical protein